MTIKIAIQISSIDKRFGNRGCAGYVRYLSVSIAVSDSDHDTWL